MHSVWQHAFCVFLDLFSAVWFTLFFSFAIMCTFPESQIKQIWRIQCDDMHFVFFLVYSVLSDLGPTHRFQTRFLYLAKLFSVVFRVTQFDQYVNFCDSFFLKTRIFDFQKITIFSFFKMWKSRLWLNVWFGFRTYVNVELTMARPLAVTARTCNNPFSFNT